MDAGRRQRISELVEAALARPEAERERYLRAECRGDAALLSESRARLAAATALNDAGTFAAGSIDETLVAGSKMATDFPAESNDAETLAAPPGGGANLSKPLFGTRHSGAATGSHRLPDIPGYEITREIHRGGQGIVYQAIQKSTKRKVAIKLLMEGAYASPTVRRRFEREVELAGQLKHPNIIAILHSGRTEDGHDYCVMDYVRGLRLDQYVRQHDLPLENVLRLFAAVCEAVNYAHQKGVIHRDLKPSNILVDAEGNPRVLDFGLARQLASPESVQVSLTGQVVGTLPYMSPEQAEGNPDKIDTRTDVYALGVILYELLTGQYPYPVAGQMADVLRHIAGTAPTPPSRAWKSGSGVSKRTMKRLRPGDCPVDDEVQTIVLRTLSKERERRYQSAGELAKDIGHYLAGEPIEAKKDSALYVWRKQLARHKGPVAAAAAIVLSLVGGLAGTMWQAHRANERAEAARKAETAAREAEQAARDAEQAARNAELEQRRLAESEAAARKEAEQQENRAAEAKAAAETEARKLKALYDFLRKDLVSAVHVRTQDDRSEVSMLDVINAAAQGIEDKYQDNPEVEAIVRLTLGVCLELMGNLEAAEVQFRLGVELQKSTFGSESIEYCDALVKLGALLAKRGRAAEGLPLLDEAADVLETKAGATTVELAASLDSLAACLSALGRASEALPKYQAALEMYRRLFIGDHADVAKALNNVAHCLESLGRPAEALPMHEAALEMQQRLFKGDHPAVAQSLNNVGGCLNSLGRTAEALPKHEAALVMWQRQYPGDHPAVAAGLSNVALCLDLLGRPAEALPMHQESLEMKRRLFPGDHPDTVRSLNNTARCLESLGRAGEALPMYESALKMAQQLFGGDHPYVATCLNNVAYCLQTLGRAAEALSKFEAALEMQQRLYRGDHPRVALGLNNVGYCLQSLGRAAEAVPKFEAGLEMFRRVLPEKHPNILYPQIGLATALIDLDRAAEAGALLIDAAEQCERSEPCWRLHWPSVAQQSVRLYDAWAASEPDQGHEARAAEWRDRLKQWQTTTRPATTQPG